VKFDIIKTHLESGGILAYPTETVWGLGADIRFPKSLEKIFEIKGRNEAKAMSVLVKDNYQAKQLAHVTPKIEKFLEVFWPGPVTFVLRCKASVPTVISGDTGYVGLRCSSHPFVRGLFRTFNGVITTTSANPTGQSAALKREDLSWLPGEVLCVDWMEPLAVSAASTVVKITDDKLECLRQGDLDFTLISGFNSRLERHS